MIDKKNTIIWFFLPSVFRVALSKELIHCVPEGIHSTNIKTLGKFDVSGSDYINWGPLGLDG